MSKTNTAPATTAPATTAPATTAGTAPVKKDTVKIRLPLTKTEKDDVYVALNGTAYLIKRGIEVEVPKGVAEILAHKERMLVTSMEFEAELAANANKE